MRLVNKVVCTDVPGAVHIPIEEGVAARAQVDPPATISDTLTHVHAHSIRLLPGATHHDLVALAPRPLFERPCLREWALIVIAMLDATARGAAGAITRTSREEPNGAVPRHSRPLLS